jgi:hypothetical protein
MPARLRLLCLLLGSSWLTAEGDRLVGAAGELHCRGGRAVVACRSMWVVAFQTGGRLRWYVSNGDLESSVPAAVEPPYREDEH